MNTMAIKEYKATIQISNRQHEAIIGSALGDGHIELPGKYPRLRIEHSYRQKEYVDWKYAILKSLTWSAPKEKVGFKRHNYFFNTLSIPQFVWYYKTFGNRKIPEDIENHLTPLTLAIWFMDDGSVKSKQCRGVYLQTQSFSSQNLKRLQQALLGRYEIETNVVQDNRLYFPARTGARKLKKIILPYIQPCMKYKCQC